MPFDYFLSGRPGSNWPPIAWKAIALPNELLPLVLSYFIKTIFKRTSGQ